jgi:hypothetical protein
LLDGTEQAGCRKRGNDEDVRAGLLLRSSALTPVLFEERVHVVVNLGEVGTPTEGAAAEQAPKSSRPDLVGGNSMFDPAEVPL